MRSFGNWTSRDTETAICLWPLASTILLQKRSSTPGPHLADDLFCPGAQGRLGLSALPEYLSSIWYIQRKCQIILLWYPSGNRMSLVNVWKWGQVFYYSFIQRKLWRVHASDDWNHVTQGPPACLSSSHVSLYFTPISSIAGLLISHSVSTIARTIFLLSRNMLFIKQDGCYKIIWHLLAIWWWWEARNW